MSTLAVAVPLRPFAILTRNRALISLLAARELRDRYAGSVLGTLWAVLQPLMLLGVFAVVFGYVFRARGGTTGLEGLPTDYTSYMIAGFVPWYAFTAALQGSAGTIRANAGLVKQIDFPVGVLPVKTVMTQVPVVFVGVVGLLLYQGIGFAHFPPTLLLLPAALVLLFLVTVGLAWALAALGAYFRDLEPILANLFLIAFYLLPIFFVPGFVPEVLEPLIAWNPFTPLILVFQDVLVFGAVRSPGAWTFFAVFSIAAFLLGHRIFERLRPGFGSVV